MAYGYSLVGEIAAVGAGVPARSVGSLVFAFAPHATAALVDAGAYQAVPAGISAADAAFLPAAETAISIVHDAHPRAAETVHVFGCGVIGLLVLAALKALGVRAVAVDPDASRRALALSLGASAAYPPATAPRRAADVTIECSGNPAALQGAIDGALDSGRVVLASWYGRKPVGLVLGTRFHRSHLEIIASQVSVITGPHASRWSKGRRFGAAWDLLRAFKPASTLPVLTLPLQRAPEAYELLDRNAATVVLLSYGEGDKGAPFGLSHRSRI
jgi:threonine dehydrogenase-like Zn-dependent dehydrogenase